MASMVHHGFFKVKDEGEIAVFKSYKKGVPDGGARRDFVYVKDIVSVMLFFLEHADVSGIFNVGTGNAQSFYELAEAVFMACGKKPNISFNEMPKEIREQFQYFTQADISRLRSVGYSQSFKNLEEGVQDYVQNYLELKYEKGYRP